MEENLTDSEKLFIKFCEDQGFHIERIPIKGKDGINRLRLNDYVDYDADS